MENKTRDVASVCNALVDILVDVDDAFIQEFGLRKGTMHLVDSKAQSKALDRLKEHQFTVELGGSCLNAIRALAALDLKTFFAGCISNDSFGTKIRKRMEELKIAHALGEADESTGTCLILITPDGERTMLTNLGASRLYKPDHIPVDQINQAKVFHFAGYQWDTAEQKESILKVLSAAKRSGTLISFDVADPFVVEKNKQDFKNLIQDYADVVFANREEARLLFDTSSPQEAIAQMSGKNRVGALKLGGDGALIGKDATVHHIAPHKTTVVDTTAAGDMFAGGFLYGYIRNLGLKRSGEIAAFLASDVISRVGATLSSDAIAKVRSDSINENKF